MTLDGRKCDRGKRVSRKKKGDVFTKKNVTTIKRNHKNLGREKDRNKITWPGRKKARSQATKGRGKNSLCTGKETPLSYTRELQKDLPDRRKEA